MPATVIDPLGCETIPLRCDRSITLHVTVSSSIHERVMKRSFCGVYATKLQQRARAITLRSRHRRSAVRSSVHARSHPHVTRRDLLCVCHLGPPTARAQSGSAVIRGRVTDSAGGVLQGATVTLAPNAGSAVTDTQGAYSIGGLPPGSYTVQVNYVGFDRVHEDGRRG